MMIELFKTEIDRRLHEGATRIDTCLSLISHEELWHKPGSQLVSIGNLVNHLRGNISQWVLKELGECDYVRQRDSEFSETTGESPQVLASILRSTVDQARTVVAGLPVSAFERTYTVQGFRETGVGILIHVVEHLSYHVGQITFYVKLVKETDVGYYGGIDLDTP